MAVQAPVISEMLPIDVDNCSEEEAFQVGRIDPRLVLTSTFVLSRPFEFTWSPRVSFSTI